MLERAQGSAARESMVAADEKRVHSPAELANRDTSYSSSSSIVPVASFQKKTHVVESRQYILAGLRVEGPEPHAFVTVMSRPGASSNSARIRCTSPNLSSFASVGT